MTFKTTQRVFEQPIALVAILASLGLTAWAWNTTQDEVGDEWPWLAGTTLLLALVLFIPLTVMVDESTVRVWLAGLRARTIPLAEIDAVKVREYHPLRQFGGWGVRFGANGSRAYTMTGKRAVVVTLRDGREVYLGTRDLDALADQIDRARATAR